MPINKPKQVRSFANQRRYFYNLNTGKKLDCLNCITLMQKGKCFITDNKGMQIKQTFNVIQPAKGKNNEFIAFKSIVFYCQKLIQKLPIYSQANLLKRRIKKRVLRELIINKN